LKNVGYYNINNKLYCDIHAKTVARANPPGPNLEPVTIPTNQINQQNISALPMANIPMANIPMATAAGSANNSPGIKSPG